MNAFVFLFSYIGIMAAIVGSCWVLVQVLEYCWEVRRTLRDCRDALRRLEARRKESL
jgi:hypothetical protein